MPHQTNNKGAKSRVLESLTVLFDDEALNDHLSCEVSSSVSESEVDLRVSGGAPQPETTGGKKRVRVSNYSMPVLPLRNDDVAGP